MTARIYKRISDRGAVSWSYSIHLGKGPDGLRNRTSKHGFKTKREAHDASQHAIAELKQRAPASTADQTLGSLLNLWLDQHAAKKCSPKTVERYRQLATYIDPELTAAPLSDVNTLMIEMELTRLLEGGGKDGAPLAPKTIRHIHGVIHAAMRKGVGWGLLRSNSAAGCELPRVPRPTTRALDSDQLEQYIDACRRHWIYPILEFAAATGARRGEMLALTWGDLDLDGAAVHITKSLEQTAAGLRLKPPKNGSPRILPLPDTLMDVLRSHRGQQDAHRKIFASDYRADLDLIFPGPGGEYLKPDTVTATACLMASKAGLKGVGLHSLRHSHGSLLLSAGVSLPTVSKRLGHADPAITARVYSHTFNRDERAAASIWDSVVSRSRKGARNAA